ncbi:YceK/YidQ family lipoprotein [Photobacterium sp. TLY01]|uniref:YceK/YidQ family lipoprotein n=1 Tax=Photobacterium sp. TLY01 TaxID=2907534 RepID=UPI001F21F30F|nr:YceK/YidQ family lipoprotein [Photobacterium sp. TLY01]UIP26740.1 YceK/YidQ family lipoprotein [Photobacterium sp. TLY01]
MRKMSLLLCVCLLTGCSSIASRVGSGYQVGQPYGGFDYATDNAECNVYALLAFPPIVIVTIPLSVVDIVTSAALDTALLPLDLILEDNGNHKTSFCHMSWR